MDYTPTLTPSDFVAIFNQTMDIAFPIVVINGEISNFRISKNKWVYFDIKDESASLKCFTTTYSLKLPIQDGMKVNMTARPQLHPLYNLSMTVLDIQPSGEGSIKKAIDILKDKLEKEGLFAEDRKRALPYPPKSIGLITSSESAAYGDFIKVLNNRWPILDIKLIDTKVQGDGASDEIISAIQNFNQHTTVDVLVIIRGGGSADDLLAFQHENLVRIIAESRIPTLVAIGHERDISLSELAADLRASTPSNAAEILVPSREEVINFYKTKIINSKSTIISIYETSVKDLEFNKNSLEQAVDKMFNINKILIDAYNRTLKAIDPDAVLKKGYALIKNSNGRLVSNGANLKKDEIISIKFSDTERDARVLG